MTITDWPFLIEVDGDFEQGHEATVIVDARSPITDERLAKLNYAVEAFAALAAAGGLGGDRVQPSKSTGSLSEPPTISGELRATWKLSDLAIDARALVVLFNVLSMLGDDLDRVSVMAPGVIPVASLTRDVLPPAWPQLPFKLEDDRIGPQVELNIDLAFAPLESQIEDILDRLECWLACGSIQGFRDWTSPPDKSFLTPTTDPEFQMADDSISAILEDSGVLDGCYDILTNVLIKLHAIVPVDELSLS
jgi:hypothetical protein